MSLSSPFLGLLPTSSFSSSCHFYPPFIFPSITRSRRQYLRKITANRPDTIIRNKKEKTCTLVDVAIPSDRNVVQKEVDKKLKCKSVGI
jgi:hypothetical protein